MAIHSIFKLVEQGAQEASDDSRNVKLPRWSGNARGMSNITLYTIIIVWRGCEISINEVIK